MLGKSTKRITPRLFALLLALAFALGCAACTRNEKIVSTFTAMDTVMTFTVYANDAVLREGQALVAELEKKLSVTDAGSEIYAVNSHGGGRLSPDVNELVRTALGLCRETDGALDITIYPVVRAWGFTTGEYRVPSGEELAELLENVDYSAVLTDSGGCKLQEGAMLDLGAVAKGYTADRLAKLFRERGVESAIVNLGGNVYALGHKPDGSSWTVAIQDPESEDYACVLSAADTAVVTSGGYQRFFEQDGVKYQHIIDPATGRPASSGLASVSIVSESGLTADAFSTALYVMGLERAIAFWRERGGFEAVFITESGEMFATEGLEGVISPRGRFAGKEITIVKR